MDRQMDNLKTQCLQPPKVDRGIKIPVGSAYQTRLSIKNYKIIFMQINAKITAKGLFNVQHFKLLLINPKLLHI